MSNLNLSVNYLKEYLSLLDEYSSNILLELHKTNPNFNSKLLIEKYLEDKQAKTNGNGEGQSSIDVKIHLELIEDLSVLKFSFIKLFNQLDGLRDKKTQVDGSSTTITATAAASSANESASSKRRRRRKSITSGSGAGGAGSGAGTSITISSGKIKELSIDDFDIYFTLFQQGSIAERVNRNLRALSNQEKDLPISAVYESKLIGKFEDLIISYLTFVHLRVVINNLLNTNFEIIDNLTYFQDLLNDSFYIRKLYHFLKVSPQAITGFIFDIVNEFKELVRKDDTGSYLNQANALRLKLLVSNTFVKNFQNVTKLPFNIIASELRNNRKAFDISLNAKGTFHTLTQQQNPLSPIAIIKQAVAILLKPLAFTYDFVSSYVNRFLGLFQYPQYLIDSYFDVKVNELNELKYQNIEKLGALITELPKFEIYDLLVDSQQFNSENANELIEQKSDDTDAFRKNSFDSLLKLNYILLNSSIDTRLSNLSTKDLFGLVSSSSDFAITSDYSKHTDKLTNDEIFSVLNYHQRKLLPKQQKRLNQTLIKLSKPTSLASSWPLLAIALFYGPHLAQVIYESRYKIIAWVNENLVTTVIKFYQNWIYKPILNIIKTVRHDDNSQISIMGKKSLASDIDSLERMILDYLKQTGQLASVNAANVEVIKQNIHDGDLTPFMKDYETQISKPIKNLVVGDLLQSLLIQVQKTKVDGDLVISGIDKLLKSQELVFEFIAILPTGLIVIWVLRNFRLIAKKGWRSIFSINLSSYRSHAKRNLNTIERLLILGQQDSRDHSNEANYVNYFNNGELLIEILLLEKNLAKVLPNSRLGELKLDIGDLNNKCLLNEFKVKIVEKMWRNYGQYLN